MALTGLLSNLKAQQSLESAARVRSDSLNSGLRARTPAEAPGPRRGALKDTVLLVLAEADEPLTAKNSRAGGKPSAPASSQTP
jgi:hypothetical protein